MTAKIYKTTGEVLEVSPKENNQFSLSEMQKFVGGYIEIIWLSSTEVMVLNEEGRLNGLPCNVDASNLANQHIVGNVLICNVNQIN
jgi:hypothetical protein